MPIERPIFRYALLAFLFAITVAYEVLYLHDVLRDETRSVPFFAMEVASNRVSLVAREAVQAGIRQGDEVLSIDGRPYNGAGDWGHALVDEAVGGSVTVVLGSSDSSQPGERTIVLPVKAVRADPWQIAGEVTLYFLLPAVCVLLGFWVALRRPHDPMAWLLLALMLTFPHVFESYETQSWPPGWREAAMFLPRFAPSHVTGRDVSVRPLLPRAVSLRHISRQVLETPTMGSGGPLRDLRDDRRDRVGA